MITKSAVRGTSAVIGSSSRSLLAHDQPRVRRRLVNRHASGPVRAELRGNAEPAHPLLAHRRRLVSRPQHVERQRPDWRPEGRQRNAIDRRPRGLSEQEPYLLAAAPTLAGAHARAREPLDLILIEWPIAQQRGDAAGAHLRRLPLEIARRLRLDQPAPRDLLPLTAVQLPPT